MLQPSSPKRAAAAQHINRFQQTRLAGTIGPTDEGESGIEIKRRRLQAAEIRYLQLAK
jgi:hypothetical protein